MSRVFRFSGDDVEMLLDWALENRVIVALEPGIASVRGPEGPILVSYGPASLLSPQPPPTPGALELVRSEWVTGCEAGRGEPRVREVRGRVVRVEGVIVARAYKDPVASLVNGVRGVYELVEPIIGGRWAVYAEVEDRPVLARTLEGEYVSFIASGPLRGVIRYAAALISSCRAKD